MRHLPSIALLVSLTALAGQSSAIAKDISLTPDQIQRLEIKLEPVQPTANEPVALLPATVIPALNARLAATAPFAGTVVQLHVLPGQNVAQGDPIATVASRDLLEAQGLIAQSEAELHAASAIADRKRDLADKKIVNVTIAEEAEAQVAKIRAVVAQHKSAISIGGIEASDGGQYTIRAPAAGTVAHVDATTGEPIAAMAAAASIDTRDELWLDVQIPASLVARIHVGGLVRVVDGPEGNVIAVSNNIDKMTRSARLLASVSKNSGLMPGQMVKINLMRSAETGSLQVPSEAVAWIAGEPQVFTRNDQGFSLKPVNVRGRSIDFATVSGELTAGDLVAASGLPQLESIAGGN